ncbi:MAG: hypothetical protein EA392_03135 [Cryomorphaceae bacterium]|nr:MAG: hypothetical protein EA392_03135 [Cryomorphaceae bacterium]
MAKRFLTALGVLLSLSASSQWHSEFNYGLAFSDGAFHDFAPSVGFWNVQYQARKQITDRYSFGGAIGWSYFEHDFGRITRTDGASAITANMVSYTNILTIQTVNQYNLAGDGDVIPFLRLGAGVAYQNQQEDIGLYSVGEKGWQFALNPELGVRIALSDDLGLHIAGGYHYLPEGSGLLTTSFWSIKIGLDWLRK